MLATNFPNGAPFVRPILMFMALLTLLSVSNCSEPNHIAREMQSQLR